MEILQTFLCSFPNWCRQCSRIVVDKAINITTVAWMNCTETRDYRMTVNNSRGSVLHETDVSCCKGSITIKYMKDIIDDSTLLKIGSTIFQNMTDAPSNMTNLKNQLKDDLSTNTAIIIGVVTVSSVLVITIFVFFIVVRLKKN
ncbi:uncharacterized protein LOC130054658 [Ostrea edulis]|uniref:uncharacterized protein LOC130054658 n=1 Tax=Ostrea edulis TaxID=37623 RepID=UPI0024AEBD40|nr:uncharacterized protein LOC130054658 [Ostrea edulis]